MIRNPAMFFVFQHPAFGGLYSVPECSSGTRIQSLLSEFLFKPEVDKLIEAIAHQYNPLPYHNLVHAQHVVDSADKLAAMQGLGKRDRMVLVLAAMMHDVGHSGGEHPDVQNVKRAVAISRLILKGQSLNGYHEEVGSLIEVTAFNEEDRTFIKEPQTMSEYILRDADLLGFQYQDWPDQLAGLAKEMGINVDNVPDALHFLYAHLEFMKSVPMYTDFGKSVKNKYVEALTEALIRSFKICKE